MKLTMPDAERLTIFEIGSIYGIAPRSLRFYEDQGLLAPIIEGGDRFYTARDRVRVELILKGKKLGFSFIELKILISSTLEERGRGEISTIGTRDFLAKEDIVEEIWQTERKIEALMKRVQELQSQLGRLKP